MTLPPTLTLNYWFNISPPPFAPLFREIILATFVALLVVGVVAQVAQLRAGFDKATRRLLSRSGTLLITSGLIGLLLYGFEYEQIPFLTIRAFYLVLFIWFVWDAWRIFSYATKDIPAIHAQEKAHLEYTKWLPKKKK